MPSKARGIGSPVAGDLGICELSDVGVRNQTPPLHPAFACPFPKKSFIDLLVCLFVYLCLYSFAPVCVVRGQLVG